jgi:hypothetical protein
MINSVDNVMRYLIKEKFFTFIKEIRSNNVKVKPHSEICKRIGDIFSITYCERISILYQNFLMVTNMFESAGGKSDITVVCKGYLNFGKFVCNISALTFWTRESKDSQLEKVSDTSLADISKRAALLIAAKTERYII